MKLNQRSKKTDRTLQVVTPIRDKQSGRTKSNGVVKSINSRDFETRMIPRYDSIPQLPKDIPEATFSESAQKILRERYLLKGTDGIEIMETIPERFWKVAYDVASAEFDFGASKKQVYDKAIEFYKLMVTQLFEPNSPTLMNSGKKNGLQYSACFVLPIEDSLAGIFDTIKAAALIHKTGGGTGFSFSRLRSNGAPVNTTGGVSSGPVSFLRVFNAATESIKQGGTRRGANMGILRIDHPDILEFIRSKSDLDDHNQPLYDNIAPLLPNDDARFYFKTLMLDRQISNFNISCAVTDKFMQAYYSGEDFDLIDPRTKMMIGTLNAKEVFDEIIERAWRTGDPGLVFIDRINNSTSNPVRELEEIEATNPCGEQPLAPWDACNLGSINLGKVVLPDGSGVDWEELKRVTHLAVNFLDNVVQVNPYTLEQIYDEVHSNRRIGLGVMGWADMLFRMRIAYNSDEALKLAEDVMRFINEEGHASSQNLAAVRGAFPNWSHSIYKADKPLRNSTVTTIAPTGTISIIADCSSGIEPVFALAYIHRAKTRGNEMRTLTIANQTFEDIAKREGFYSPELTDDVMRQGSVMGLEVVPEDWQRVFVTAPEIEPEWHVQMQSAFQKYTDNGVSKTINLPNSATIEDVKKAYLMAWETGCMGITVYRDGSKGAQTLNIGGSLKKTETTALEEVTSETLSQDSFAHRPMVLRGRTYRMQTPVGEGFITINRDENNLPFEVFITIGRGGMHTMADAEAMGRLVSLSLRLSRGGSKDPNTVAQKIVAQLQGIGGSSHIGFGKNRIMSLADAIAKALAEDLAQASQEETSADTIPLNLTLSDDVVEGSVEVSSVDKSELLKNADLCPECGDAAFVFEEGCKKCHSCGYSMC